MSMYNNLYDPNYRNQYRAIVQNLWAQVVRNLAPNTTSAEQAMLQQRYSMNVENWINQFMQIQQNRGGNLDQNQMYTALMTDAQNAIQQCRMQSGANPFGGGAFGAPPMPTMAPMGMGNPMYGMPTMSGMPGGMPGAGYGMMGRPMTPPPPPATNVNASMNAVYGDTQKLPAAPAPMPQANITPGYTPGVPQAPQQTTANTIPQVKVTPSVAQFIEPKATKMVSISNAKTNVGGTQREFETADNTRLVTITVNVKKFVSNILNTLKELVGIYKPDFAFISYRKYRLMNMTSSTMIKAITEIHKIIDAADPNTEAVGIINDIVAHLNQVSSGCEKFFQTMAVHEFNRFVITVGHKDLAIKTFEDISEIITSTKDNRILVIIDTVLQNVVKMFRGLDIYEPNAPEVVDYLENDIAKSGKTCKQLREEDADAYAKFCRENCVVVSPEKQLMFSTMLFDNQINATENDLTVMAQNIFIENTPPDSMLEYFIKSNLRSNETMDLVVQTGNIVSMYQVASCEHTDIGVRMKSLF